MLHQAPVLSYALHFRSNATLLASLKRNSKSQMNAEEAEIQEEKMFSLIAVH